MKRILITSLVCLSISLPTFAKHTHGHTTQQRVATKTSHFAIAHKKSLHSLTQHKLAAKKPVVKPNVITAQKATKKIIAKNSVTKVEIPKELRMADNLGADKSTIDFDLVKAEMDESKQVKPQGPREIMV